MMVTDKIILAAAGRSPTFIRHPESPGRNSPDSRDTIYGRILGSQNIYEMFRQQHIYTELYIDCAMGHGLDKDGPGFMSNFGTTLTNSTDVNLYIVQRACVFFQSVMNGKAYDFYKTTKFVECANYRNKCVDSPYPSCVTDSFPNNQKCP